MGFAAHVKNTQDGRQYVVSTMRNPGLKIWEAVVFHPGPQPTAPVCCTREGAMLGPSTITHILHRLSRRTGLSQRIGPHALRHSPLDHLRVPTEMRTGMTAKV